MAGGNILTPYADNLSGCITLLLAMEQLAADQPGSLPNDVYFVFSVQEEVGLRGARVAAHWIDPYMSVAVDVCSTGDSPESDEKMVVKLGEGPAIKLKDQSVICNPQTVQHLRQAAESSGIPYQDEILTAGGTDAGAIQRDVYKRQRYRAPACR